MSQLQSELKQASHMIEIAHSLLAEALHRGLVGRSDDHVSTGLQVRQVNGFDQLWSTSFSFLLACLLAHVCLQKQAC